MRFILLSLTFLSLSFASVIDEYLASLRANAQKRIQTLQPLMPNEVKFYSPLNILVKKVKPSLVSLAMAMI